MTATTFTLAGALLTALPSGALWIGAESLLCVSDLHFGKSERMARRSGALVPPYENRETLDRLAADILSHQPRRIICLGDNFDDAQALDGLDGADMDRLAALKAGRHWTWIAGNHDPGPVGIAGTWANEVRVGPLTFRHIAAPGPVTGEVSGHYHPKHRLNGARSSVTRKAFLHDGNRLILPAYGTYTGGLRSDDACLRSLFGPVAHAILTGPTAMVCPLD